MLAELPQELIDRIIDEIALDVSRDTREIIRDVKNLSLFSPKFHPRSRAYLFRTLEINSNTFPRWCGDVRPGRDGPSRFVTSIRYHPSFPEAECQKGPLEGLSRSPSHMSAFTNLRILHFVDISLRHTKYLTCFGGLVPAVRELWLEDCQMDITKFVSFVQPFANLERLRLMRPQCPDENKLQNLDMVERPPLKGTLECHQPDVAVFKNFPTFIQEFSLLPTAFSTIVFRGGLDTPTAANQLLAASHTTLTKLTFCHNSEVQFPCFDPSVQLTASKPHLAVDNNINLKHLNALKELELSTLDVRVLPRVLRTVKSNKLKTIRFFLLVYQHQLEDGVAEPMRRSWEKLDVELCVLVNRVQAASGYSGGELQVKFVDLDSTTPEWLVGNVARMYFPRSHAHKYISFSVDPVYN